MTQTEIESAIRPLIGLKLSIARRAADLRNFQFGDIRPAPPGIRPGPRGTVGEYALHIQCPWRIDGPEGIVTGRTDLYKLPSGDYPPDDWEPKHGNNRQDDRIGRLLGVEDLLAGAYINQTGLLVVEKVWASAFGDVILFLSGGYRIVIFPSGTTGEAWRVFRSSGHPHFVVDEEGAAWTPL